MNYAVKTLLSNWNFIAIQFKEIHIFKLIHIFFSFVLGSHLIATQGLLLKDHWELEGWGGALRNHMRYRNRKMICQVQGKLLDISTIVPPPNSIYFKEQWD